MLKVSIIIRTYNSQKTIARAVESALNQNFPKHEFEVLIINDGSIDQTRKILKNYEKFANIRIVDQENNGSILAANIGFELSKGDYAVLLDSDDIFEDSLLRVESRILDKNQDIAFVYCDYYESAKGRKKMVRIKNIFQTIAVGTMYRRDELKKVGYFRTDVLLAEYELFLRMRNKWVSSHVTKPLVTYNRRENSISNDNRWYINGIEQLKRLYPNSIKVIEKIRPYAFEK